MEPTSSPENVPQSRGVARFWPSHGMPAPGQRTPASEEPEGAGPDLAPHPDQNLPGGTAPGPNLPGGTAPGLNLPGHQTPALDLPATPMLPTQPPGPADDIEVTGLGGRRGPEALLGSVSGARPWSANQGGFPAVDADRTYRNGDSGAHPGPVNGRGSSTGASGSVMSFPLGRAEAPRPPVNGSGENPPPAWAAPTSGAAVPPPPAGLPGVGIPPLPPGAAAGPTVGSAAPPTTPGPATPGLPAAAPPPPGLDASTLPTSVASAPLAPVSGAVSATPPAPLLPAPAVPVSGAPVSGAPVPETSRASRRVRDDDEAVAGGRRPSGLGTDDGVAGRRRGNDGDAASGPDGRAALRPGDVRETEIAFWDEAGAAHFRAEWHEVKAGFVDDPVAALTRAHDLLTEAVHELTESLLAERDELDPLRHTAAPDTESMRMAMRGYREFLERILSL
ncbi:hypothetical protein [Krasilnikovia sp. MM14-A1004]|uniref:hypothetical protein n=1 Tax=Krasilnikovia sp. MM14-A1004 TaxID=3373541 RepID=UPI00399CF8F0